MHKFFDYLEPDLPVNVIRDLLGYIRRSAALFSGGGNPYSYAVPQDPHRPCRGLRPADHHRQ